jgi:predicted phage terminase large subunit-like protein
MMIDDTDVIEIRPQPGPQEAFLSTSADIAIYGGAAGGGKSWGLLLEPLRHVTSVKDFSALFLRRNTTQIKNPGGLWDESMKLYPLAGGNPIKHVLEWEFEDFGKIKMSHLEYESSVLDWQGSQIPLICFDELTHFSETQFFYMLSRNRSTSGVKPYVRATCNPDADSWVAQFIEWWIDQNTGYAIPERAGVLRWFIRQGESLIWSDSEEELIEKYSTDKKQARPKSVTFISAKLEDNKILEKIDPSYRANLEALSYVEQERLLGGNWKVKPSAGLYFKRSDVSIIDALPSNVVNIVRKWDLAATEPNQANPNPDWSAGVKLAKLSNGRYVVVDVVRFRKRAHDVRQTVRAIAERDGASVIVGITQDPGQAGKEQAANYVSLLEGFAVKIANASGAGDKVTQAEPFASQWQGGNVDILHGDWNEDYLKEMDAFPTPKIHDDQVDGSSGAFSLVSQRIPQAPVSAGAREY